MISCASRLVDRVWAGDEVGVAYELSVNALFAASPFHTHYTTIYI